MLLAQQTQGHRRRMTPVRCEQVIIAIRFAGMLPSNNPSGVPADSKLCCGDDQYRKYVGPDNTNRCYEKQPDGTWAYTYASRCDAHDHDCYVKFCAY
jgi:hypothetical protein